MPGAQRTASLGARRPLPGKGRGRRARVDMADNRVGGVNSGSRALGPTTEKVKLNGERSVSELARRLTVDPDRLAALNRDVLKDSGSWRSGRVLELALPTG